VSGIHQFVPMLHRHDAVGEHTRSLRDRLVAAGFTSRIYTELPDPETVDETRPYLTYPEDAEPGDVLVYQFATESVMARWLAARRQPLVINYHSATPPEYFIPWNNAIARLQVQSLLELADIAPRADLGIAVSEFDAIELREAGCASTVVIPVANVAYPPVAADPDTAARLERERRARKPGVGASWLSVGRLAPNKGHQDALAALFVTRMTTDPGARLTLVGAPSEPNYAGALRRYANSLGLSDAVDFVSGVDVAQLAAYYRASDAVRTRGLRGAPDRSHVPWGPGGGLPGRCGGRDRRGRRRAARSETSSSCRFRRPPASRRSQRGRAVGGEGSGTGRGYGPPECGESPGGGGASPVGPDDGDRGNRGHLRLMLHHRRVVSK